VAEEKNKARKGLEEAEGVVVWKVHHSSLSLFYST